jgi:DeoR family transcriptional regulator, aga operon transcriptional repressor
MRRTERLNAILDLVAGAGSVDVVHLASCLGVSGATIRRDLQSLSRRNLLVRTHGGAVANAVANAVATGLAEAVPDRAPPDRTNRLSEKRRIAQAAAALVSEGAVVGMTGGTTATELARALADRHGITVVTNALNIAADLTTRPGTRLVVITGMARHGSYELVGPAAEAMLANYHLDIAFIGVDGLSSHEGCTTNEEMEAQTDLAMISRARRRVVIADSSKIGKVTFARICPLSSVTDVVTDCDADSAQLQGLRSAGLEVLAV